MADEAKLPERPGDPSGQPSQETQAEQSVQAFRDALDKSVTVSREKLQEVVDEAVERGRMTRADAEELVGRFVEKIREAGSGAAAQPTRTAKRAAGRARRELGDAAERAREEVGARAENARQRTVAAVEQPLASADRVRRKAGVPGLPISAYDQLSVRQITARLPDLTGEELRKVRAYEQAHKARKGLLRALDRKLSG